MGRNNKELKKIIVKDSCVACGACIVMSSHLEEAADGRVKAKDLGIINENEAMIFQQVIEACPVNAIEIINEEITSAKQEEAIIRLKTLIENLLEDKIDVISYDDISFKFENNETLITVSDTVSNIIYPNYDSAYKAAKDFFRNNVYSQRDSIVQAIIINYKITVLHKVLKYEEVKGNFYYDNNEKISKALEEIIYLAQSIANNELNIPKDYHKFNVIPKGNYISKLDELENIKVENSKDRRFFESQIEVNNMNGGYFYDIETAVESLKSLTVLDVAGAMFKYVDEIFEEIIEYRNNCKKAREDKITFIKEALREYNNKNANKTIGDDSLKVEIEELISNLKKIKLEVEEPYFMVDFDYNNDFRFNSRKECRVCAENRRERYYEESVEYFTPNNSENVACDLGKLYEKQISNIFNKFLKELHIIFDKYNVKYPVVKIETSTENYSTIIDLNSAKDIEIKIRDIITDFVDSNIIGYGNEIYGPNHLEESDVEIEVVDSVEFRTGFLGREKEYEVYAYLLDFSKFDKNFNKLCKMCGESKRLKKLTDKIFNELRMSFLEDLKIKKLF